VKKKLGTLAAVGAVALLAAGCGEAPETATGAGSGSATSGASDVKACMVSDSGGFDDQSFNQSGKEGLDAAVAELGIEAQTTQSSSEADFAPNIAALVQQSCNMVISVGFALADATGTAADANPDTQFAIIDSTVEPARDNVKPLLFDTAQAAYLAGYVAAGTSKTGTVATYGGSQFPSVTIFMDGFADGVAKYNQDNGASVQLLGWDKASQTGSFTGNFEDIGAGQNTTQNFIEQGADVILPVAGPVGAGSLAAAASANGSGSDVKVVWVDSDGYDTVDEQYKPLILTSIVKEIGASVQDAVKSEVEGTYSSEPYVGTLENGGVSLAPFHDNEATVPQAVKDAVTQLQQDIIDGTITVQSQSTP